MPRRTAAETPLPDLRVIPASLGPKGPPPPKHLGKPGRELWGAVTARFEFGNPVSYRILAEACEAADRAEACRLSIEANGLMIGAKNGQIANPLVNAELANRTFLVRSLTKLGIDLEPIRQPTRKPGMA